MTDREVLHELADLETSALRSLNLYQLEELLKRKEEFLDSLGSRDLNLDVNDIQSIREKLEICHSLGKATSRGIKSIIERIAATRRAVEHLDTYDGSGRRMDLASEGGRLLKRS